MKFEKSQYADNEMILAILCGAVTMVGISAVLSLIAPMLVINNILNEASIGIASILIHIISTMIGTLIAGVMAHKFKTLTMCLSGGVYYLFMLSAAMLFFDGITHNVLYGLLACSVGTLLSLLVLKKKTRTIRRKVRRHR